MRRLYYIFWGVIFFTLVSCNDRDKIVNIDLPDYQPQNVLECYLDSGQINRLLLTKSASFQDTLYPVVTDAFITITNNNIIDTLVYKPLIDTTYLKVYTHQGKKTFQFKEGESYNLNIKLSNGQEITGVTTYKPKVKIDTIIYDLSEDKKYYNLNVKFKDNQGIRNFYRAVFNVNGVIYNSNNIDYVFDDNNLKTTTAAVVTNYRFSPKDTVIVSFYNLSEDYYRYLRSVRLADNANGNPFAQPASIQSNISGGIGIFTNLVYDRDTIYLPK